jgi:hypothetical protein
VTQYGVSAGMPGELPSDTDLPVLSLEATTLRAEAGGQAQTTLKLRNPGHLVESFRLDVVGLDDGWWQVHPPELALYPGEDSTAVVVLTPPAEARAPDRPLPFGVRAISTLDSSRGVVEEGDLEVGRVFDLQPTISPVTSRARWSARHTITFTNWGNTPVRLKLSASDKDGRLGFQLDPEALAVPVGGSASARLRVRPSDPFLRGTPVHLPFQVRGEQPGAAPAGPRSAAQRAGVPDPNTPVVDGAVLHGPILSKGIIVLLIAAIAGIAAAGALLWRTGDVKGARTPDAAPGVPQAVSVNAVTDTLVRVAWNRDDRALGYKVQTFDADGAAVKVDEVKAGIDAFDAKVEEAGVETCYEVVAVRGTLASGPSERKCATTPEVSLEPPTDVEATLSGPGTLQVSWQGNEKNTHAVLVNGAAANPDVGTGILSAVVKDVASGKQCVTVFARRGDKVSEPSEEKCVEVAGAEPTTAPGGNGGPVTPPSEGGDGNGGDGGPTPSVTGGSAAPNLTGVVAMIGEPLPKSDQILALRRADLQKNDILADIVLASSVPNAPGGPFANPDIALLVVRGFGSEDAAEDFCTGVLAPVSKLSCQPVRVE